MQKIKYWLRGKKKPVEQEFCSSKGTLMTSLMLFLLSGAPFWCIWNISKYIKLFSPNFWLVAWSLWAFRMIVSVWLGYCSGCQVQKPLDRYPQVGPEVSRPLRAVRWEFAMGSREELGCWSGNLSTLLLEKLTQKLPQTSTELNRVVTGSLCADGDVPDLIGTFWKLREIWV